MAFNTGKAQSLVRDRFNLAPLDITADHVKGEVLSYFRYNRAGVNMCCTEFQDPYTNSIEDILVREQRGENTIYHAIEVKISEADFKREFWHKKEKHKEHGNGRFYDVFYFAVTKEIQDLVFEYLELEQLPYGLIVVSYGENKQIQCNLVKRPDRLIRSDDVDEATIDAAICKRMSSEIAASRCDIYKLRSGLAEVKRQIYMLSQSIKLS